MRRATQGPPYRWPIVGRRGNGPTRGRSLRTTGRVASGCRGETAPGGIPMNATDTHPATVPAVILEPLAQAMADALAAGGGPPLFTLSPVEARAVLDRAQAGEVAMAPA